MTWSEFEAAAPELAQWGWERFRSIGVAFVGTIRRDGSPRISPIEPFFAEGQLLLGMLWGSKKALDLRRDSRCVIHSVVSDVEGSEGEFKLRGRAIEVREEKTWQQYRATFAERWGPNAPQRFHIFSLEIESASLITWEENGRVQVLRFWSKDGGLRETRRKVALMDMQDGTNAGLTQEMIDEFVGMSHGNAARIRELLAQYPQLVNASASWGETPIEAAAQVASKEIMKLLLDAGAPLDICTIAALGDTERVLSMLEADPDLKNATGAHGIPIMHYPVVTGNRELAELLLERGADVNAGGGGNTALHGAAYFNQAEMARWLIEHGADANALDYEGKTPLTRAIESDSQAVAEVLREHGAH